MILPTHIEKPALQSLALRIPFVLFRQPGKPYQLWANSRGLVIAAPTLNEIPESRGFLMAPFSPSGSTPYVLLQPDIVIEGTGDSRPLVFHESGSEKSSFNEAWKQTRKSAYLSQVNQVIREIRDQKMKKVVLSRISTTQRLSNKKLLQCFSALADAHPSAFVYLAQFDPVGTWMGATPEVLLHCSNGRCSTMALAGTRQVGLRAKWTQKEYDEQAFVVQHITQTLQNFKAENVGVAGPSTITAGSLQHLCTTFEFTPGCSLRQLAGALHPTPAVCGIPSDKALREIQRLEAHPRQYYTGFLGPIDSNGIFLYVNLRCMKITKRQMILFAGGGLTSDSVPQREWEETTAKTNTLLSVIRKIRNLAE